MLVLGICGSLRPGSYNRMLLLAAARGLPADAEFELWERLDELPVYAEHLDGEKAPPAARSLREAIAAADGLLIATPEYNASMPGGLKNALDWASRPYPGNTLQGKPLAVIGVSTGLFGAVWAQADARKVLKTIGAHVLEAEMPLGQAHDAFDERGELRDGAQHARLHAIVTELSHKAGASRAQAA